MKYGIIYKITNKINGKIYIGKTVQAFKDRVKEHKYKSCRAFNNAIQSYGWDSFEKEEFISALDESYLASLEEQTIKYFDCLAPKGYNLVEIDNGLNRYSQEIKNKISESRQQYLANLEKPLVAVNKKEHIFENGIELKHCYKCDQNKTLDCFSKYKARWDGLVPHCKECQKIVQKNYPYKKMSDEDLKQSYINRQKNVSDGVLKAYENNPELKQKQSERKSKAIIATNIATNIETEYESGLVCKQKTGICNKSISRAIKNGKPYAGYTWRFK